MRLLGRGEAAIDLADLRVSLGIGERAVNPGAVDLALQIGTVAGGVGRRGHRPDLNPDPGPGTGPGPGLRNLIAICSPGPLGIPVDARLYRPLHRELPAALRRHQPDGDHPDLPQRHREPPGGGPAAADVAGDAHRRRAVGADPVRGPTDLFPSRHHRQRPAGGGRPDPAGAQHLQPDLRRLPPARPDRGGGGPGVGRHRAARHPADRRPGGDHLDPGVAGGLRLHPHAALFDRQYGPGVPDPGRQPLHRPRHRHRRLAGDRQGGEPLPGRDLGGDDPRRGGGDAPRRQVRAQGREPAAGPLRSATSIRTRWSSARSRRPAARACASASTGDSFFSSTSQA